MNNVILDGVVWKDVETKSVNRSPVANFALLHKSEKENVFIGCEAWGNLAKDLANIKKDTKLIISGKLKEFSYEKDGKKETKLRIRITSFSFGEFADGVSAKPEVQEEEEEVAF
jgi:single-stranded DNA-binding protein